MSGMEVEQPHLSGDEMESSTQQQEQQPPRVTLSLGTDSFQQITPNTTPSVPSSSTMTLNTAGLYGVGGSAPPAHPLTSTQAVVGTSSYTVGNSSGNELDTSVRVAVRLRPMSDMERQLDPTSVVSTIPSTGAGEAPQIVAGSDMFSFDYVFGSESTQRELYETCVDDLLTATFEGFNATILAYGQTGSGKTFTMGSAAEGPMANIPSNSLAGGIPGGGSASSGEESLGIIPRVIGELFQRIRIKEEENSAHSYKVYVQFLELYGEEIRDLLDWNGTSQAAAVVAPTGGVFFTGSNAPSMGGKSSGRVVAIRETTKGEVFVTGAREEHVSSFEQMMRALEEGTRNRTTAATKMNQTSSRSHAIFTVTLEHTIFSESSTGTSITTPPPTNVSGGSDTMDIASSPELQSNSGTTTQPPPSGETTQVTAEVRKCKFHFVDLAGSERAKRTGAHGQQLREGIEINKGLLALGNVISALGDESKRGKVFVPYRDSKLTRMLQDSLGGNSKTLMICCVSPASVNLLETINALRYANRARNIKNKPVVNRDPTLQMVEELKSCVRVLAGELYEWRTKRNGEVVVNSTISMNVLSGLVSGKSGWSDMGSSPNGKSPPPAIAASNGISGNNVVSASGNNGTLTAEISKLRRQLKRASEDAEAQRRRSLELEAELLRQSSTIAHLNERLDSSQEVIASVRNEAAFFRWKWSDADPSAAAELAVAEANVGDSTMDKASFHAASSMAATAASLANLTFIESGSSVTAVLDNSANNTGLAGGSVSQTGAALLLSKSRFMETLQTQLAAIEEVKKQVAAEAEAKFALAAGSVNDHLSSSPHGNPPSSSEGDVPWDDELVTAVHALMSEASSELNVEAAKLRAYFEDSAHSAPNTLHTGGVSGIDSETQLSEVVAFEAATAAMEEAVIQSDDAHRASTRRQAAMSEEVAELSASILLKQALMTQLARSQAQNAAMREYYSARTASLQEEVQHAEEEREKLAQELKRVEIIRQQNDLSRGTNPDSVVNAAEHSSREKRLREELRLKDEALRVMRRRQAELQTLSAGQSAYAKQMARLEADVVAMKRTRVELTRGLAAEKKAHTVAVANQAKEIAKLRRELNRASMEAAKLTRSKDVAEQRARDAVRDNQNRRRMGITPGTTVSSSASTTSSSGVSAETRAALRAISRLTSGTGSGSSRRVLSEEETRLKRWIAVRVREIAAREATAETLKRKYEDKLELIGRKERLESQRAAAAASVIPIDGDTNMEANSSALSGGEQAKLLDMLEQRLAVVNNQLSAQNRQIEDAEQRLSSMPASGQMTSSGVSNSSTAVMSAMNSLLDGEGTYTVDSACEALRRSTGSLSACHQVIRLLFELLLHASREADEAAGVSDEMRNKARSAEERIEELERKLAGIRRAHDRQMTEMATDYENKVISYRSLLATVAPTPSVPLPDNGDTSALMEVDECLASLLPEGMPVPVFKDEASLQAGLLREELSLARQQRDQYAERISSLNELLEEALSLEFNLRHELSERIAQTEFLREDRAMYKQTIEELSAALRQLGSEGRSALSNARDATLVRVSRSGGASSDYLQPTDEEGGQLHSLTYALHEAATMPTPTIAPTSNAVQDDEDDSRSLIGAFDNLAAEINRTGAVSSRASTGQSIYDRLTNPTNYTARMKNVFINERPGKRERIQRGKERAKDPKKEMIICTNPNSVHALFQATPTSTRRAIISDNSGSSLPTPSPSISGVSRAFFQADAESYLPPPPPNESSRDLNSSGEISPPPPPQRLSQRRPKTIGSTSDDISLESFSVYPAGVNYPGGQVIDSRTPNSASARSTPRGGSTIPATTQKIRRVMSTSADDFNRMEL